MTPFSVTERIAAGQASARSMQETPVRRRSATPVRKIRTAALTREEPCVPMTEMTCTDDTCDGAGACAHPNNTASCDDGLYCNGTDTCGGGSCSVHTGSPCPETDCNTCQEDTDSCFDPASTVCTDDGNICTDDTCNGTGAL